MNSRPVQGRPYFVVMFHDPDLRIPVIQTVVFERIVRREDGVERFLFENLSSDEDEAQLIIDAIDLPRIVHDTEQLIQKLSDCAAGKLTECPRRNPG